MEIADDLKILLKTICRELKNNNLQFCLAGGWAVSMFGIARTTVDVDILIVFDVNTRNRLSSILEKSFNLIQSHEQDMVFKNITIWRNIISLKGKTEPLILDYLKADSDYLMDVINRRIEIPFEDTIIPVIAIEDLITIKLTSFRKQDQIDIENLIQSGVSIDWEYLENSIKRYHLDWDFIEHLRL